ncbi:MAG: SpaA isopeptide-forming pilin-related protein [Candidatus Diapherotrites archaeon]
MTARASADGYQLAAGIPLSDGGKISLQEVQQDSGTLIVKIFDESGARVTDVDFEISIFNSSNTKLNYLHSGNRGEAEFQSVPVGTINVSVTDGTGKYGLAQRSTVIEKNKEKKLDVTVSRNTRGKLNLEVIDIETRDKIPNAQARILDSTGKVVGTKDTGNDANNLVFAFVDLGNYTLQVGHADYLAYSRDFNIDGTGNVSITAELAQCKDSLHNCGILVITVKDEENKKVENATVSLYDAGGFLSPGIQPQSTDVNGIARFSDLPAGEYYVKVFKYPAEKTSSNFTIDPKVENAQTVQLTIGKSNIIVSAKDRDGKAIPNAKIEFRDDAGLECGAGKCTSNADSNGKATIKLKSDKKIYVIVTATDYVQWVSQLYQLQPNQDLTINAVLEKTILGDTPEISVKFYENSTSTHEVSELKSGKSYVARIELRIPTELNGKKAGVHFRTGTEKLVENDVLYIKSVNVAEASQLKGTTFNPPTGESEDLDNLTNGNAKWVNLSWNSAVQGIYNIEVEFYVRETVVAGTELTFNYRAWAVNSSGEYVRDPDDAELGTSQTTSSKQELYASTKTSLYYAGVPADCDDDFCWSGEKVYDQQERVNLNGTGDYTLRASSPYSVHFVITNNSQTNYGEGFLRIMNSDNEGVSEADVLEIQNYSITNASAQNYANNSLNDYRIPDINLGDYENGTNLIVDLDLVPKKVENSTLYIQVISSNEVAYSRSIDFSVQSENELSLTIQPEFFPAFISFDGNAIVKDEEGFEVKDASVKISKILDNSETVLSTQQTDQMGKVSFSILASTNQTIIRFEASKDNYSPVVEDKLIDQNVITFEPEELASSLDPKATTEKDIDVEGTNEVAIPLKLTDSLVSGDFKGYLDEGKMNNYLAQYENSLQFSPSTSQDFTVRTALALGKNISKTETVQGRTWLQVSNAELTKDWQFTLPLNVTVGPGGAPEDECLTLSISEWDTTTLEDTASIEFSIANNCQVSGKDISIQNLAAQLDWSSNVFGNVSVMLSDGQGKSAQETLRDNDSVVLFDSLSPGQELYGILTFVPNSGTAGKNAKFEVSFTATTPTSSGNEEIQANHSIDSDILIANLQQCLQFSPDSSEGVTIARGTDDAEFTVDSSECGDIALQVRFCQDSGNTNCRGGTSEGGIYFDSAQQVTLNGDSKNIKISRSDIGGYYDIVVEAKAPGKNWQKVLDYPVIVEPDTSQYFCLDRYSFLLLGQSAQDSATLTSDRVIEPVAVTADNCAWKDFSKNKNYMGVGLGLAAVGSWVAYITFTEGTGFLLNTLGFFIFEHFSWLGPTIIIIGIVLFLADLFGLFGDCHDDTQTNTLYDYIVNLPGSGDPGGGTEKYLPPDAQSIEIKDSSDISVAWNLDVTNYYDNSGTTQQDVGVVFTNNTGIEQNEPIYAVAEFSATEHIHGDVAHGGNAAVDCGNGNFGTYWIGSANNQGDCNPVSEKTRTQKIHLKFRTKETTQQIPQVEFDTYACSSGNLLGVTGPGANPNVKLNWNWSNQDGITKDQCDVSNPNAVYCDATQFNIELVKKLKDLDEFFVANNYFAGVCPPDAWETAQEETDTQSKTHTVEAGKVGVSSFSSSYSGGDITFNYTIVNNGSSATTVSMDVNVYNSSLSGDQIVEGTAASRKNEYALNAGESKSDSVTFSLSGDTYQARFLVYGGSAPVDAWNEPINFVIVDYEDPLTALGYNCSTARTTADLTGKPIIDYFIETLGENNVHWTSAIPSKQALNDTLKFNAYLMKEGYSDDFKTDFTKYYTEVNFADTLPEFSTKWKSYYDSNYLQFSQKYYASNQLDSPGKYQVAIEAYFGDDWRFFESDTNSTPKSFALIVFYKLEDPQNDSPFYWVPLDGLVGVENSGTSFNRQGYGTKFVNSDGVIFIDNLNVPLKTYADSGSNAIQTLNTSEVTDLKTLNADISTRGDVLDVKNETQTFKLDWSPAFATPVLLKMTQAETTQEPFGAFYTLTESGVPKNIGNTLSYWDGAGNCVDFGGTTVVQAFAQKPDRAATSADPVSSWQTAYAVDWEKADYAGDVYLRSIFYTNRDSTNALQINSPISSATLISPDGQGTTIGLNGISTMQHNRQGNGATDTIYSVKDVFDLVDQNLLCVTDNGVRARFWWNPQQIYKQGSTNNIHTITQGLQAGVSCIGYGS